MEKVEIDARWDVKRPATTESSQILLKDDRLSYGEASTRRKQALSPSDIANSKKFKKSQRSLKVLLPKKKFDLFLSNFFFSINSAWRHALARN